MKYRVHVYAIVRVPFVVEAESQEQAMKKAEEAEDFYTILDNTRYGIEYAGTVDSFLVDEIADDEYKNTRAYNSEYQPINASPPRKETP